LIRERLWEEPDQFIFNKNEYIQYFPHDEYKDESKKESWEKGVLIFEKSDSTNTQHSPFTIDHSPLTQGWYVIEASAKNQYGQEVKDVKYFQVYDTKSPSLPAPAYVWNYLEKKSLESGETAHVITGTSARDLFLIQEISNPKNSENYVSDLNYFSLNNNKKVFDFNIS
jgi:hypothetical protein